MIQYVTPPSKCTWRNHNPSLSNKTTGVSQHCFSRTSRCLFHAYANSCSDQFILSHRLPLLWAPQGIEPSRSFYKCHGHSLLNWPLTSPPPDTAAISTPIQEQHIPTLRRKLSFISLFCLVLYCSFCSLPITAQESSTSFEISDASGLTVTSLTWQWRS